MIIVLINGDKYETKSFENIGITIKFKAYDRMGILTKVTVPWTSILCMLETITKKA